MAHQYISVEDLASIGLTAQQMQRLPFETRIALQKRSAQHQSGSRATRASSSNEPSSSRRRQPYSSSMEQPSSRSMKGLSPAAADTRHGSSRLRSQHAAHSAHRRGTVMAEEDTDSSDDGEQPLQDSPSTSIDFQKYGQAASWFASFIKSSIFSFASAVNRAASGRSGFWPQMPFVVLSCIAVTICFQLVMIRYPALDPAQYIPIPSHMSSVEAVPHTTFIKHSDADIVLQPELDAFFDGLNHKLDELERSQLADEEEIVFQINELAAQDREIKKTLEVVMPYLGRIKTLGDRTVENMQAIIDEATELGFGPPFLGDTDRDHPITFSELRLRQADRTGRENLANPFAGARVMSELTTSSSGQDGAHGTKPGWASRLWNKVLRRSEARGYSPSPRMHWALTPGADPGHCWEFPVEHEAELGISLTRPANIDSFSIEHTPRDLAQDRNQAPLDVELWGVVDSDNEHAMEELTIWRMFMKSRGQPQRTRPERNLVLLGGMRYDASEWARSDIQTVEVDPAVRLLQSKIGSVQLRFKGNHGAKNTCIYRVRIHPETGEH
ncbi:hypothetical protein CF326_g7706 [Tilletia indica]|nr:hypothetical protein CF326_g7706 [Tilletia indica]